MLAKDGPCHALGHTNAVDTRRQDTARITCTFTGREQAAHVEALQVFTAGYAQR